MSKDFTRADVLRYLDHFRKDESVDPSHKWIGTYNQNLGHVIEFFKWLYTVRALASIIPAAACRLQGCLPPAAGSGGRGDSGILNTPSVCSNCLTKITQQDEQEVLNSKSPLSQSDLPSEQSSSQSENPNPSESANPSEQSPPSVQLVVKSIFLKSVTVKLGGSWNNIAPNFFPVLKVAVSYFNLYSLINNFGMY